MCQKQKHQTNHHQESDVDNRIVFQFTNARTTIVINYVGLINIVVIIFNIIDIKMHEKKRDLLVEKENTCMF